MHSREKLIDTHRKRMSARYVKAEIPQPPSPALNLDLGFPKATPRANRSAHASYSILDRERVRLLHTILDGRAMRPVDVLALNQPLDASQLCADKLTFTPRFNLKVKPFSWLPKVVQTVGDLGHGELLGAATVEAPKIGKKRIIVVQGLDVLSPFKRALLMGHEEVVHDPDGSSLSVGFDLDDNAKAGGKPVSGVLSPEIITVGIGKVNGVGVVGVVLEFFWRRRGHQSGQM